MTACPSLRQRVLPALAAFLTFGALALGAHPAFADGDGYKVANLVSNIPGLAAQTDANLVNPWGLSFSPTGPFWISDNGSGLSTLYTGAGQIVPLVVTVPPPMSSSSGGTPTGQVFNGTPDFVVSSGSSSGPALFIFAGEDGTISGWNPAVPPTAGGPSTLATLAVDRSATGAVYKGIALAHNFFGNFLYAANFRAGTVDVFDNDYAFIGAFTDPRIPAGFAPFGIQTIENNLVVTYAKQKPDKHDDLAGPGNGFVDIFSPYGILLRRLASHGPLNSPWGVALAPAHFGRFSHMLLIGNFGDGRINAFDPQNGHFRGALRDGREHAIAIDGLWGLAFGNGGKAGDKNALYFTAGLNGEQDGLFGSIQTVRDAEDN